MFNLDSEKQILSDYDRLSPVYALLTTKIEQLFRDILEVHGIMVHAVSSRVKSRDSVSKKISKSTTNYERLEDLTDISGLRITTYFSDDVDRIGKILEDQFIVDAHNSVDKRNSLAVDKFGYLSLHHVLLLSDERAKLVEYQAFKEMKFEVQTRSILQHAWAEIEHDLGYKSTIQVPKHLTRRFALVAGQLESVDNEFNRIKAELEDYRKNLAETVNNEPSKVPLSIDSLNALAKESPLIAEIDNNLSFETKLRLEAPGNSRSSVINTQFLSLFHDAGMKTIDDVLDGLKKYRPLILLRANISTRTFTDEDRGKQYLNRGASLDYLGSVVGYFFKPHILNNEINRIILEGAERQSIISTFEIARKDFLSKLS